ncbi:MAG: hypothetical protein HQL38_20100 [Alphaproteobacteria bacterium]|nr:hypothetical protein [Alphaproteobacteria bacterium]
MLDQMIMAKVEGTTQAALLSSMTGNSYTVGQVTATGNGMGHWLFLNPAGATVGKGAVALKLEGASQVAQLSGMVGKTVTIGKAPLVADGVGKWLVLCPKAGIAAKGAAVAAGAAGAGGLTAAATQGGGNGMIMMKLEGARQAGQVQMMAGKTFMVAKTTAAGNGAANWLFLQPVGETAATMKDLVVLKVQHGAGQMPWLVGKTFAIGESPMMAGTTSKFLVLNPVTGVAAKGAAGTALAAKGAMQTVALQTAGKTAVAGSVAKGAAAGAATKGAAAVGTLWTGTGMSLGLGLGLGAAGPAIVGGVIAAAGYGIYRYRKARTTSAASELDHAISDAVTV